MTAVVFRIAGLLDDSPHVELVADCLHCRTELLRRRYDTRVIDMNVVVDDAQRDGLRTLAHHCAERN